MLTPHGWRTCDAICHAATGLALAPIMRRRPRRIAARIGSCLTTVLLLVAPANTLPAQSLAGYVRDTLGMPLIAATVSLMPGGAATRTDETGRFVFPSLAEGEYALTIRRVGYRPYERSVILVARQRTRLEIQLRRTAPTLDTVRARVDQSTCNNRTIFGFECRRQAGIGHFRDAAELAALQPVHLFDLLRDLPGIRMAIGRGPNGLPEFVPSVRPSRCLRQLINGRPLFGNRWWSAEDVVAVEYYDDRRKIPLDYRQIANTGSCELIVYWLNTAIVDEP